MNLHHFEQVRKHFDTACCCFRAVTLKIICNTHFQIFPVLPLLTLLQYLYVQSSSPCSWASAAGSRFDPWPEVCLEGVKEYLAGRNSGFCFELFYVFIAFGFLPKWPCLQNPSASCHISSLFIAFQGGLYIVYMYIYIYYVYIWLYIYIHTHKGSNLKVLKILKGSSEPVVNSSTPKKYLSSFLGPDLDKLGRRTSEPLRAHVRRATFGQLICGILGYHHDQNITSTWRFLNNIWANCTEPSGLPQMQNDQEFLLFPSGEDEHEQKDP